MGSLPALLEPAPSPSPLPSRNTSTVEKDTIWERHGPPPRAVGRNLVLCFDGTTNTFNPMLTNLPVLFSLLDADPRRQLCYYQTGIGTYEPAWTPSGILKATGRLIDSAIAWNLGQHVTDGYKFLMQYYQPGDRIFLFGFSRGAYTARALAGMLQQVGLLLTGNEQSVSLAYHIYSGRDKWLVKPKCDNSGCLQCGELLADGFKRSFCREVHLHFVGVWDTVASVGAIVPRNLPFAQGGKTIGFFRHALSADEHRARFEPQLWMGDLDKPNTECTYKGPSILPQPPMPRDPDEPLRTSVKELWFSGKHPKFWSTLRS
ncbi:hypothetical protein T439DRAFT_383099 [Meredithblackwellia eburnea MCA 4105]